MNTNDNTTWRTLSLRRIMHLVFGAGLISAYIGLSRFECEDIKYVCAPFGERVECKVKKSAEKVDVSDMRMSGKEFQKHFPTIAKVSGTGVPKVVHQINLLDQNSDLTVYRGYAEDYMTSFRREMPDWTLVLWTDAEVEEFIRKQYPQHIDLYMGFYQTMSRGDMLKYILLHAFGGVYADLDVKMLSSIEPELGSPTEGVWVPYWRHAETALLASVPEHPFWDHLLELLHERDPALKFFEFDYDVLATTGPMAFQHAHEAFTRAAAASNGEVLKGLGKVVSWPKDRFLFAAHMTPEQARRSGKPISHHYFVHEWLWKTKKTIFVSIGFALVVLYVLLTLLYVTYSYRRSTRGPKKEE